MFGFFFGHKRIVLVGPVLALALAVLLCAIAPGTAQAAVQSAKVNGLGSFTPQATTSLTQMGVDVSEHNGSINWKRVKAAKVKYAIVRCGYGDDWASQDDKRWRENIKGCQANGIPFGIYIYSYATTTAQAKSEARHVLRCIREAGLSPSKIRLPIYYDLEDPCAADLSPAQFKAMFTSFRSVLNSAGYGKVGVYGSASWWRNQLSAITLQGNYRWIAHWGCDDPFAYGYDDLRSKGCGLWQCTSDGAVDGMAGRVDINYARSSLVAGSGSTAAKTSAAAKKPVKYNVYCLYNPNTGERRYTVDSMECGWLEGRGWRFEGVAWKQSSTSVMNPYHQFKKYTLGVKVPTKFQ